MMMPALTPVACFTGSRARAIPIRCFSAETWKSTQIASKQRNQAKAFGFGSEGGGKAGDVCVITGDDGTPQTVFAITEDPARATCYATIRARVPAGVYTATVKDADTTRLFAIGWGMESYRYTHFKTIATNDKKQPQLLWPSTATGPMKAADKKAVLAQMKAVYLVRDLINAPANVLNPQSLAQCARDVARTHGAKVRVLAGDALLKHNYPAIHAVGRAGGTPPCLIDMTWGNPRHPKVTLVGKGVCFDTGGLDIKPAAGMKMMKKDMGGAAHVLGLASMIMAQGLSMRLRVLIPAVENSISGNAMRPLDVLPSRKGTSIEIGHTDAEGRVILADALWEATRQKPALIIDCATLTGAARVALGTEIPALFSNDDTLAAGIVQAGEMVGDRVWQLPLWHDYRRHIRSKTADISNDAATGYGGAITAALFLEHFITPKNLALSAPPWVHLDMMAWNTGARAGHPEGGEAQGLLALYGYLHRAFP